MKKYIEIKKTKRKAEKYVENILREERPPQNEKEIGKENIQR